MRKKSQLTSALECAAKLNLKRKKENFSTINCCQRLLQHLRREGTVDVFFVVVRVHESRYTSSEGDPQLGKFVLSRQVNLNTPGLSKALLAICFMSVLSVCEPSIEGKISKILIEFCIS